MTSAIRMADQRKARKASGKVELRVWVSPKAAFALSYLMGVKGKSKHDAADDAIMTAYYEETIV